MTISGSTLQNTPRKANEITPLGPEDIARFSKLLLGRCGLHFSDNRRSELEYGIRHAFASSSCATMDEFYNLIASAQNGSIEMDLLVNAVTVSETHFFRDAAQFNALANSVFPEIIQRKSAQSAQSALRAMRIWSAGCASGEEPYSIAMLLRQILPDIDSWSITILATDINTTLLERARIASYGQWAFREERAISMRSRYFRAEGNRFELDPEIRRMVTFGRLNLAESTYPSFETNSMMMDLIICRNVTIYFPEMVTRQIVGRFHTALVDGGWLVVGHAEPSVEIYKQFQARNFPDTVIYQRDDSRPQPPPSLFPAAQATVPPATGIPVAAPLPARPQTGPLAASPSEPAPGNSGKEKPSEVLERARELVEFGHNQEALTLLEKLVQANPRYAQAHRLLGQTHADRGAWTEAEICCRQAIQIDKLDLHAYYTLGLVLQHQMRLAEAVEMMKKVVYLDHTYVLGHYHLAGLYREQGLLPNAHKSLENALNLLHNRPPDEAIPGSGGVTVSRLRDALTRQQQALNKI